MTLNGVKVASYISKSEPWKKNQGKIERSLLKHIPIDFPIAELHLYSITMSKSICILRGGNQGQTFGRRMANFLNIRSLKFKSIMTLTAAVCSILEAMGCDWMVLE